MATQKNLYTSRNLPFNLLPRSQWEVLCKHDMRFRPLHKNTITPSGTSGYFQLRIRWGINDTWVMLEQARLPLSNKQLAELILRGEQQRMAVLIELGPPRPKRGYHPALLTKDDKLRVKRYRRKVARGSSDAGRARANTTLAAINARRSK